MNSVVFISLVFFLSYLYIDAQTVTNFNGRVTDRNFFTSLDSSKIVGVNADNPSDTLFMAYTENGTYDGKVITTAINDATEVPLEFKVSQNYPNPFNPSTSINFQTPSEGDYLFEIYDILGQSVFKRDMNNLSSGGHQIKLSGFDAAGVYIYRISNDEFSDSKKMIVQDGGSGNISFSISNGPGFLGKTDGSNRIRIIASKEGYYPDSTEVSWEIGGTYTKDFQLQQISVPDTFSYSAHVNLVPTSIDGEGLSISEGSGLFSGETDTSGTFTNDVYVQYIENPEESGDRIYTPSVLDVTISGPRVHDLNLQKEITGEDISDEVDVSQRYLPRTATLTVFTRDDNTLQGISSDYAGYKDSSDSTMVSEVTNGNGVDVVNVEYLGLLDGDPEGLFNNVGDFRVEANADGYISGQMTVPFKNDMSVSIDLTEIVAPTYNFVSSFKLPTEEETSGIVANVRTQEGDVQQFVKQPDGKYHFSVQTNHPDDVKLWINTDVYQDLIIQRRSDHQPGDLVLAQNDRLGPGELDTLSLPDVSSLENLGETYFYVMPNKIPDHRSPGDSIDMKSPEVMRIIGNRVGDGRTASYEKDVIDTLDVVVKTWNITTGQQVSQSDIDSAMTAYEMILPLTRGGVPYKIYTISSENDPRWQDIVSRGYDHMAQSWFQNTGTAGNGIFYTSWNDGLQREHDSFKLCNEGQDLGTHIEESVQQIFSLDDPNGVDNLEPWIFDNNSLTYFLELSASYVSISQNQRYVYRSESLSSTNAAEEN